MWGTANHSDYDSWKTTGCCLEETLVTSGHIGVDMAAYCDNSATSIFQPAIGQF